MERSDLPTGMDRLRDTARAWLASARPARIVQVLQARGSTPRAAGTRMLVAADAVAGTIGGGHLELEAIRLARADLPGGPRAAPFERRFALGPSLGQCCGGDVVLRIEPLTDAAMAPWRPRPARFHLQLFGAGHVGRALIDVLAALPCTVDWIDERDDAFAIWRQEHGGDAPRAGIDCVAVDAVEAEVARAPAGAFYLVMTHSHDLDLRLCDAVLRRGDAGFLGVIGSATKRIRFERRLRERGLDDTAIAAMRCPVGVDGIDGKEPEIIAVAVAAELLRRSSGRDPLHHGS